MNRILILCIAVGLLSTSSVARSAKTWKVQKANNPRVVIDLDRTLRSDFDVASMLGVNLNYLAFQRQLWAANRVKPGVVESLGRHLPGIRYRYPGGMASNGFHWRGSLGTVAKRLDHKDVYGKKLQKPLFGIEEYLKFVEQVDGAHWYVLNLVGLNPADPSAESDTQAVAQHNAELARTLGGNRRYSNNQRYFQLGNELDRSRYEWPYNKYVERSRASIDAIRKIDSDAKFVAFLRAFKYRYRKDKSRGESLPAEYITTVLKGLPEVRDYSLMQYYDGKRSDGKIWTVPFWIGKINQSIGIYRQVRNGDSPRVWITEHARQSSSNKPGTDNSSRVTSNQSAAVSTADYLTAISQIPEVAGAFWHGLNAGPWQLFDVRAERRDLSPRPVFWALATLGSTSYPNLYATTTSSPNTSGYKGGYDIRATAFGDNAGALTIWAINRSNGETATRFNLKAWSGRKVSMTHRYTSAASGADADAANLPVDINLDGKAMSATVGGNGDLQITLPPSSVSSITLIQAGQ